MLALILTVLFLLPGGGRIGVITNFEGGSLGKVVQISPTHLRCTLKTQWDHDHRNSQADYYYFELTRLPRKPITVDFVDLMVEFYDFHGPFDALDKGERPVYSYDDIHWKHFPIDEVHWDPHGPKLTLHFTPKTNRMWIAHVAPYTNKNLASLLDAFHGNPYMKVQTVGHTVEGRKMLLLTITNTRIPESKKKVIWLMFRQHAWETGSSWVCDGAVRFLLSNDLRAVRIRDEVVYNIFPMAAPDGVANGWVRFNANGYDLNRNWDTPNPKTMPEIWAQRKAILDWVDSGHRLDLFLTLHDTETHEYLEAPAAYHTLGERVFQALVKTTSFNPTSPLRTMAVSTTPGMPGRMMVNQGLFHDRHLPAMMMEQMIEYDSKLGHYPTVADRETFGAELVRALAHVVTTESLEVSRFNAY